MNIEYWFPTPIFVWDIPNANELNTHLEKHIVEWSQKDPGLAKTNVNGWHSTSDMHVRPEYKPLVDILYSAQREVFTHQHLEVNPVLGNMWANINPKGGWNRAHVHPNCIYSGVYYIKTPDNCGHLKFEDPRPGVQLSIPARKDEQHRPDTWREVHYQPVAGRLIMFPFWLNHLVEPNQSDDIRISVSFNFLQDRLHNLIKPEDVKQ